MEFYCVKCKKKVDTDKYENKKTKNGRNYVLGICPNCNSKMTKFIKK
jgi:DNA-directed RNA polymerase subunit RPC12/RpoP